MDPGKYWHYTFLELQLVLKYRKAQIELEEIRDEWDWARVRSLWVILANAHRDPKKRPAPFEPTDLIKLKHLDKKKAEEKKVVTDISDEHFKRLKERYTKNGK